MHVKVGTIHKTQTQSNVLLATRVIYELNEKLLTIINIREQLTVFVRSVQIQY